MTYKTRLAEVRRNDAEHEAMMQDAAKKAGVDLEKIRAMRLKTRDSAMMRMFAKARATP